MRDPTRHSWLLVMEAFATVLSYSATAAVELRLAAEGAGRRLITDEVALPYDLFFAAMPAAHREFFEGLVRSFRADGALFVHGDDMPESDTKEVVVYGHWNDAIVDADGWPRPLITERRIGIDTIAHGILTAIRLPDRRVFQSRRHMATAAAV